MSAKERWGLLKPNLLTGKKITENVWVQLKISLKKYKTKNIVFTEEHSSSDESYSSQSDENASIISNNKTELNYYKKKSVLRNGN